MTNATSSRFALTFRRLLPSSRTALGTRFCSSIISLAVAVVTLVLWAYARPVSAASVGNAFSYQGRLLTADGPANGTYDITFSLYAVNVGGTAISPRLTNSGVTVANGLFAAELDFGNVFNGTAYWLEVGARTNGAPIFTAMLRQPLIAAPNALYARTAQTANSVAAGSVTGPGISASTITADKLAANIGLWDKSGPNISYSGGNVGIGTTTPGAKLEVRVPGDNATIRLNSGDADSGQHYSALDFIDSRNSGWGIGKDPYNDFYIDEGGVANRLTILKGGNVGIGTTAPSTKLEVAGTIKATGDVKLGAAGQYFAAAGEENLRIVRGGINPDGSIIFGTGFSVTHTNTGFYIINFAQSFSGFHATTATALDSGPVFVTQTYATAAAVHLNVWKNGAKVDVLFEFISIGPR